MVEIKHEFFSLKGHVPNLYAIVFIKVPSDANGLETHGAKLDLISLIPCLVSVMEKNRS